MKYYLKILKYKKFILNCLDITIFFFFKESSTGFIFVLHIFLKPPTELSLTNYKYDTLLSKVLPINSYTT